MHPDENRPSTLVARVAARFWRWWGIDPREAVDQGIEALEPLARARIDAMLSDRIAGMAGPALALLVALIAAQGLATAWSALETARVLAGLATVGAFGWSCWASVAGLRAAAPWLKLWWASGLGPRGFARLALFDAIRGALRDAAPRQLSGAMAVLERAAAESGVTTDRIAFRFAERFAPILLRHLARRAALVAGPLALALLHYRLAVHPSMVRDGLGMGVWELMLHPFVRFGRLVVEAWTG